MLLAGCSIFRSPTDLRGNRVDADQLKELVPGTSTRADVTALIGSPTARATFDDNTWLYVSEVTHTRIARVQGVISQQVVKLTFNDQGVLQDVKRLDKADGVPYWLVATRHPEMLAAAIESARPSDGGQHDGHQSGDWESMG